MKTFYACGVDWQHEMGEASDLEGSMPLYSSVEDLKKKRPCVSRCGIVKLELKEVSWEQPQNFEEEEDHDGLDPRVREALAKIRKRK